jgi:hypothetical protein
MGLVAIFTVFLVGTSLNVHNSGNPVDSLEEAKTRIVQDVKEGYSQESFTSFKLND